MKTEGPESDSMAMHFDRLSLHLLFVWKVELEQKVTRERRLNNTNSGLHNLLWEMEGAKPRKDEHVPRFEHFAETEDPDILR